jgi:subtilisin-like proprotein convertase family protein
MNSIHTFASLGFALTAAVIAQGQMVTVNSLIPDNDANGLVSTLNLTTSDTAIQSITVTLNISNAPGDTAWNGDLFAYLTHDSGPSTGFAVLLNRVGVSASDASGYSNRGFAITLSDTATRDVHLYQTLSPTYDSNARLTGLWQPDERNISPTSPGSDFDTASRSSNLGSFTGLNPNGLWVLFISDNSVGGQAALDSWTLSITQVPVLNITLMSTNTAIISWPSSASAFVLQQNPDPTTTNWASVTNAVDSSGTNSQVILPVASQNSYFRLIFP